MYAMVWTRRELRRSAVICVAGVLSALLCGNATAQSLQLGFPLKSKRVLFLGDSITHHGGYIAWIELQCRLQGVDPLPEFVNVGLSSETCTGLSEPDHPFPRPDIHERLDRALQQVQPDVVVACYGMNDGIYYPFSETRFAAYQKGIGRLIEKVHGAGAKLVLMTPPPFDAVPLRTQKGKLKPPGEEKYAWFAIYEHYDREVISRYARWILEQKDRVAMVVDLHSPLTQHLVEQRKQDPSYTLAPDGVHPNFLGQRMIGETVLRAWGISKMKEPGGKLAVLMQQRVEVLHDSWLTAVGHKRPGVKQGLPLGAARKQAAELLAQALPLIAERR